ncbi:hypothetical protein CBR_g49615 [Chara braunii]|uniref:HAT C-terminal dimerisation domain-containing protein n=1 Tax=Chara braunii TaxID=69332 RepID=A0A388M5L4_CHABU|nr:hypothetical protein CBR_g49615 [Chara braunii]|eukprot:GBG89762.1 hypothetical protein CBR_g49615 [Chara braunii]
MACQLPVFIRAARLTEEERDEILSAMANRTDMLLSPIHVVARLLDPMLKDIAVFSKVELMAQFKSVVEQQVGKRGSQRFTDCMDQLYDFQFGNGVFGSDRAVQRASKDKVVLWWEAHGADHPEIKTLSVKVDVTDVVDDGAVDPNDGRSGAGSTNIRRDPEVSGTSASVDRLGDVVEGEEEVEHEEDIPSEGWVDERSDSDRSWTGREEITSYILDMRSGLRSQSLQEQEAPYRHHDQGEGAEEQDGGIEENEDQHDGHGANEEQHGGDEDGVGQGCGEQHGQEG